MMAVVAIQPVTARGGQRYILTIGSTKGVRKRVERAGFDIVQDIGQANVLAVVGKTENRDGLEEIDGVQTVAKDIQILAETAAGTAQLDDSVDDDLYPLQWDKQVIDVPEAHDTATGVGTKIAIVDLGLPMNDHPDFDHVNESESRLVRNGQIHSGTGPVEFPADVHDPCAGTTTRTDHVAADVQGHGSLVGAVAAASNDGTQGLVGVAPDAELVSVRGVYWSERDFDCDDDGEVEDDVAVLATSTLDLLMSFDYSARIRADVLNFSGAWPPFPLAPQFNRAGIRAAWERVVRSVVRRGTVFVVGSGNNADDVGGNLQQGGPFMLPQSMTGALTVSATGPNDKLSFYSNYGTNVIDVAAPGGGYETEFKTFQAGKEDDEDDIDETDEPGVEWPFPRNLILSAVDPNSELGQQLGERYFYAMGTSLSGPQVAGTAALIRELHPDATPAKVQQAIEQSAEGGAGKSDEKFGAGRLNVADALDASGLN